MNSENFLSSGPFHSERPVHMACLCDVANFGDALFPLIAQNRLGHLGYRVTGVTLSGRVPWPDAPASISLRQFVGAVPDSAGLLVGGGNIIVGLPTSLTEAAIASLWIGASWHATIHEQPVIWNAPGVPRPFTRDPFGLLAKAALDAADRVAVRDADSIRFLHGIRPDIALVPDTAIDLPLLWPAATLAPVFRDLLARTSAPTDRPLIVVHVRTKDDYSHFNEIAQAVDSFADRHGVVSLLMAVGPGARDDVTLRRLSALLRSPHILVDAPRTLQEIAAALAFAHGYVGQSLHGYIAGAAYAVPGVLVSPAPARRFRGFLRHHGRPDALAPDWPTAFARLETIPRRCPLPDGMRLAVEAHWEATAATLSGTQVSRPAALTFLRLAARLGAAHLGADWALGPLRPGTYSATRSGARRSTGADGVP